MLSAIWKTILAIVYVPLLRVASDFARSGNRKETLLRIQIQFTEGIAYFSTDGSFEEKEPETLIAAYLLLLSQFFYCCEERQIEPVARVLAEQVKSGVDPTVIVDKLLHAIRQTFTSKEEDAYEGIFAYPNEPPTIYIEGIAPTRPIAKYSMVVYKKKDVWVMDLRPSYFLTMVLLPATVGLLYMCIYLEIDNEHTDLLNSCVAEYLLTLESNDFRARSEGSWSSAANEIIAKNLGI